VIGEIFGEAFDLYKRFFWRFVGTAAAVFVVVDLLSAIARTGSRNDWGDVFWVLLYLLAALIGAFWVQGALVLAVQDVRDGRIDTTISELYDRTRPRLPALIAAGVLAGIAIGIGFLLFIVPGLYLLTIWVLIVPVIVLEGKRAGESFGRSQELVRGHGWSVLGLIVLTLIGQAIAQAILIAVFTWLPRFFAAWVGGLIAHSLVIPFVALAWTLLYYRLAPAKEPAAEPTAAV